MHFKYGKTETDFLKAKDARLGEVIDRIGLIERDIHTDLFTAVVHSIVGQQISNKALETVWGRMTALLGTVDASHILEAGLERMQSCGISFIKAGNILDFASQVHDGSFDLKAVEAMSDDDAIEALSSLKGIGVWTAEMILLFCLQRPNVFSFGDLAIQRGLRMVFHHRKITRQLFEKYRRRFSPYCSVASLYLWAVAGGAIPEMKDYAPKAKPTPKTSRRKREST